MTTSSLKAELGDLIRPYVTKRAAEIIDDVVKKATKEVQERLCAEADSIALKVLAHYAVERSGQEIIIRVSKEPHGKE